MQTDPTLDRPEKNKPTQTVFEHYMQLRGCKHVDMIIPYATEQDLEGILRSYKNPCANFGSDGEGML